MTSLPLIVRVQGYSCEAGLECRQLGRPIVVGYDAEDLAVWHSEQGVICTTVTETDGKPHAPEARWRHSGCPDPRLRELSTPTMVEIVERLFREKLEQIGATRK